MKINLNELNYLEVRIWPPGRGRLTGFIGALARRQELLTTINLYSAALVDHLSISMYPNLIELDNILHVYKGENHKVKNPYENIPPGFLRKCYIGFRRCFGLTRKRVWASSIWRARSNVYDLPK